MLNYDKKNKLAFFFLKEIHVVLKPKTNLCAEPQNKAYSMHKDAIPLLMSFRSVSKKAQNSRTTLNLLYVTAPAMMLQNNV